VFASAGRILITVGIFFAVVGIALYLSEKIGWFGRLPGDFVFRKGKFTFYFPLATSIVVSVVLSLLYWFFRK
jgi:ribose/xylose/arabinose/galactoside ABC-type transport system permease subunit